MQLEAFVQTWILSAPQWHRVLMQPKSSPTPQQVASSKRRVQRVATTLPLDKRRKRRRVDYSLPLPEFARTPIMFSAALRIVIPSTNTQVFSSLCNAFACILPLDIQLKLFGYWHSVVLISVFYRFQNLCWLVLCRLNMRIYVISHFVGDAIHMFAAFRDQLGFDKGPKRDRQGINEVMFLAPSLAHRQRGDHLHFNTLPRSVLHYTNKDRAFSEIKDFMRGVSTKKSSAGPFFTIYTRKQPPPPGFVVANPHLDLLDKTSKVLSKVRPRMVHTDCLCQRYKPTVSDDAASSLIRNLPSQLEMDPTFSPLVRHYDDFVQFIRSNPRLLFFPDSDELTPPLLVS
jgi:hypothetical protein